MDAETIVITPHAGQAKMFSTDKRFILAIAGIQGGKTWGGCLWSQVELQKYPKENGLITALSKDQLNKVVIEKFLTLFPPYKKFYVKGDKTIYLPTGGKIFFRSLEEPKYVEGITAKWAWIDEADLCGFKAYTVVRGRVNATHGRMLMTSSLADNSWLSEYLQRLNPDEFEIISWGSNLNPAFSKEEWESLKRELDPALFRRRYEADIYFSSGRVYGGFNSGNHVVEAVPEDDPIDSYFIGIDWGWVDPTAVCVVGLSHKKNVYVLEDFEVEGAPEDLIAAVINKFKQTYKIKGIYADPENKTLLKSMEVKCHTTIQPGVRDIFAGTSFIRNLIFQDRFYVLKKCVNVLKEIRNYRFKEGLVTRTEEPIDDSNHTLDAIRYVVATYPIPHMKYRKPNQPTEIPDFWLRRTAAYRREYNKSKEAENAHDIW